MTWSDEVHARRTKAAVARARREGKGKEVAAVGAAKLGPMSITAAALGGAMVLSKRGASLRSAVSKLPAWSWLRHQWRVHVLRQPIHKFGASTSTRPTSARAAAGAAAKQRAQGSTGSSFSFDKSATKAGAPTQASSERRPSAKPKKKKGKGKRK
mmetsp:Transcript_12775/g.35896  ORF Transcript_12775/g.35896 Transcript_12775/m.35896 type:complete len:155 (+) Transcript_12775:112-576(+)|eukprot:CAMPEP_0117662072 /NCGR_PEP_ID=MMETSP0804-20121206/7866_1 /TAXON_ID=1074897 /ORGANISM="Tetraselmis astigmatica, Strain CCMP880" /LENGTH=154 /DNA_ID=CAMNT_0005468963 /DNA_START=196 /DNA_END=660 /DNA_ORIENTATION=-